MTRYTPVIVGVGDYINRSKKVEDAIEPLELILRAVEKSLEDTGLSKSAAEELKSRIDSVDLVRTWVCKAYMQVGHLLTFTRRGHIQTCRAFL